MTDAPRAQAGWYPDPAGRHEHRFWDGGGWTINVADNGVTGIDDRVKAAMAEQGGATTAAAAATPTRVCNGAPLPGQPIGVDAPSTRRSGPAGPLVGERRGRGRRGGRRVPGGALRALRRATRPLTEYPASVEANFVSSCVDGGGTRDACRCALTKIEADYDLDEFADVEREYTETGVLPAAIRNAALGCVSQEVQQN